MILQSPVATAVLNFAATIYLLILAIFFIQLAGPTRMEIQGLRQDAASAPNRILAQNGRNVSQSIRVMNAIHTQMKTNITSQQKIIFSAINLHASRIDGKIEITTELAEQARSSFERWKAAHSKK